MGVGLRTGPDDPLHPARYCVDHHQLPSASSP